MGTTPAEFLESFVLGNYEDFRADPGSVRRGFNAAVSAAHLADHYLYFNQRHHPGAVEKFKSIGPFSAYLERETGGAFRDIRSVSNAYKHLYTDTKPEFEAYSSVTSSGTVEVAFSGEGAEMQGLSTHFLAGGGEDDTGRVIFTRKDGSQGDLLETLGRLVAFWRVLVLGESAERAQQQVPADATVPTV